MSKTDAASAVNASATTAGTTTIEGGEFNCFIHSFKTANTEEWYKHCEAKDEDNKPTHVEEGTGECIFCHTQNIKFTDLPWTRPGTTKGVVCDGCKQTQLGGSTN